MRVTSVEGLARDQSPAVTFRFPDLGFGAAEQLVEEEKQPLRKIKINLKQPANAAAAEDAESEKSDLEEKVQNGDTAVKRAGAAGTGGDESPKKARLAAS